jgi:aryl-alcohol dehydrogenase-like predicted oxidoreductase
MIKMSRMGLGGTVVANSDKRWVRRDDFLELLDICTGELGVTYLDSAASYELSEETIGDWLTTKGSTFRQRMIVGSKVMPRFHKGKGIAEGLTRKYIGGAIEQTLRKMRLDSLDVYWMHCLDPSTELAETLRGFTDVVKAGKSRSFAVSNVNAEQLGRILSICDDEGFVRPVAVQNELNLLNWPRQQGVQELCKSEGLAFVGYSPLATGLLSGKYKVGCKPPAGSRWAKVNPSWAFDALAGFSREASRRRQSMVALSLAWCLSGRGSDVTLIGPRRAEHLEAVRAALKLKLTASERKALQELFWKA